MASAEEPLLSFSKMLATSSGSSKKIRHWHIWRRKRWRTVLKISLQAKDNYLNVVGSLQASIQADKGFQKFTPIVHFLWVELIGQNLSFLPVVAFLNQRHNHPKGVGEHVTNLMIVINNFDLRKQIRIPLYRSGPQRPPSRRRQASWSRWRCPAPACIGHAGSSGRTCDRRLSPVSCRCSPPQQLSWLCNCRCTWQWWSPRTWDLKVRSGDTNNYMKHSLATSVGDVEESGSTQSILQGIFVWAKVVVHLNIHLEVQQTKIEELPTLLATRAACCRTSAG